MTDDRLLLDNVRLTDTERLRLLREEYCALGIEPIEYPNNALVSARLVMAPPPPGEAAAKAAAASPVCAVRSAEPVEELAWVSGVMA